MNATRTAAHATARRLIGFGAALAVTVPAALVLASPASADLSSDTASSLRWMAAEEKLARDVYTALGDIYGVNQFDRIANAEQQHLSAVRTLLARYGITDPTAGDAVGAFDDPEVQALYTKLVAQGTESLAEAAQVGITIEKLDIADLEAALADKPAADISAVYTALKNGSENHLAAFTRLASGQTMTAVQNGAGAQYGPGRGQGRGMHSMQNGTGVGVQNGTGVGVQNGTGVGVQNGTGARDGSCR